MSSSSPRTAGAPHAAEGTDPQIAPHAEAALEAWATDVEAAVPRLPGLVGSISRDMRRYLNADHVAAARRFGVGPVRDSAHIATLVRSGRLVALPDSTLWWVLRELDRSHPYVTPATQAALEEIGRRFHARLEERGLPPVRFEITSVLRTAQQQAALRRRNPNASATTSSHEFGTTVDLAYHSFAAPEELERRPWRPAVQSDADAADAHAAADDPSGARVIASSERALDARMRELAMTRLDSLATQYANHLEGELGAVLQELQREGTLMTLRERSQPVFHTTVRRR
jgi:hypothetical protein